MSDTSRITRTCRRVWRRVGVPRHEAAAMAEELEADLRAAAADGIAPEDYVGSEPRAFAIAWAAERGVTRTRPRLAATALAALAGVLPGAAAGVCAAFASISDPVIDAFGEPSDATIVAVYGLGGLFAYLGALAGVAALLAWGLDPLRDRTVRAFARVVPALGVVAVAAASSFARTQGYGTDAGTMVADCGVAAAAFLVGAALTRWWVVRRAAAPQAPSASFVNAS